MPENLDHVDRLKRWVEENPEDADAPTINMTTQETFTIRQVLDEMVREREGGLAKEDHSTTQARTAVEEWLDDLDEED